MKVDNLTDNPIRAEIFSVERLKQHAESLALAQPVTNDPSKGYNLNERLQNNRKILFNSYRSISEAVNQKQAITTAAEWLIDNFHIVEEQLRDIKEHLPIWFYKELPKLADGPLKGYPRVYGLSWAFVAHTDSRFDPELLIQFVRAYQNVQPLTIGELWAIAITLRVILIENLRCLSVRITNSSQSRKMADAIADGLLGLNGGVPELSEEQLYNLDPKHLNESFLVQLIQRLRYQDPSVNTVLQWLNKKLVDMNITADELVSAEHNKQSAANLTVRNIITSMRLISAYDWRDFFESVSIVHDILSTNQLFPILDFTTQDYYFHAIEEFSKGSKYTEIEVAKIAIAKTEEYRLNNPGNEDRKGDPGYYLISSGREIFGHELKFHPSLNRRLSDFWIGHAKLGYSGTIWLLSFVVLSILLFISYKQGVTVGWLLLFTVFGFVPASDIVIAFLNKLVVIFVRPRHLPRVKLKDGVPESMATFVVMPILLINEKIIEDHIEQLEVHYLANPDGYVHFALLSDWKDSDAEINPHDSELLNIAIHGIEQLNSMYGTLPDGEKRFSIFHRERRWNPGENKWMGWERKRGKLHEFNCLLRGATDTSYIPLDHQELVVPKNIKYVITLDADTRMPLGLVKQLVGTMAHPLNVPRLDPDSRRVVEGYGILQPKVIASLPSRTNSSIFQRLFSGPCGLDPYTFTSSDIYQDLFGEGTYTGKGIYDLDIFETTLAGRIPENALLSHDLFEGTFARCGFVSDLELFEDFPSHTEVASLRLDRWVRGDWQLLPWILGFKGNSLPFIGRWKMIDNLRRSLSTPSMIATLVLAWFLPQAPYIYWTSFVVVALAFPLFLPLISGFIAFSGSRTKLYVRTNFTYEFIMSLQQTLFLLSLLLYQALHMCETIVVTLYRLFISKKKLLEWVTAAQETIRVNLSLDYFLVRHKFSVLCAILLGASLAYFRVDSGIELVAIPFIGLWVISPFVAHRVSLPPRIDPHEPLVEEEMKQLRLIARRTWKFFTSFVTEEDNLLPPDNFQEDPNPIIAHRSSPTNFGLYLLSVIAAKDFGWIGIKEMATKLEATLNVLLDLPRYNGHFYNWYELRHKEPLEPRYISSVDSGNLAGYLLVIAKTSRDALELPIPTAGGVEGIHDSLMLLRESMSKIKDKRRALAVNLENLHKAVNFLELSLYGTPETPSEYIVRWQIIKANADTVVDIAKTFAQEHGKASGNEVAFWASQVYASMQSHIDDYKQIFGWTKFFNKALPENLNLGIKQELKLLDTKETLELPLKDLALYYKKVSQSLMNLPEHVKDFSDLILMLHESQFACEALQEKLIYIAGASQKLFDEMDFMFLFDSTRKLFSIGFNVSDTRLDSSYYDMLASEARLASFVAIAKGDVPVAHWFSLSRILTTMNNDTALLSWSGSMFEYLMPSLVMYTPRDSLLDKTCRLIIKKQIDYGNNNNVPWGISESAYNIRDLNFTYQYYSFGVPGLGLKRGLEQNLVVSPYSTALAAMYFPRLALENFQKLEKIKILGSYGFYEAVDFTAPRIQEGQKQAVVQAYMAHHQGMSLVALANVAFDGIMRHRFHSIPEIKAAELLLQERTPRTVTLVQPKMGQLEVNNVKDLIQPAIRRFDLPSLPIPSTHLLSNGAYTVMISSAGSGYSRWNDMAITRWREDATCDMWGTYIFLHDTATKLSWSLGYQPTATKPNYYEAIFTEDRARIVREDSDIHSSMELVISAEDNAEIRKIAIRNTGSKAKEIELTSYAEIVLAPQAADLMHPAFSNLFVQTEYIHETTTLIATRRPRSATETPIWMAHVIAVEGNSHAGIEYETDRVRFLGRGHSIRNAVSIQEGHPLSNTVGAVLDPIVSLRTRITIQPGTTRYVSFSTIVSNSREEIIDLADKYHDPSIFERASSLAWAHARVQLHYLGIDDTEANLYQQLANSIIYLNSSMRPAKEVLKKNTLNVTGLWARQISGDNPILLVHIDSMEDHALVRQLLRAHEYWRLKRFAVDLVIINEKTTSYVQDLQILLESMVRTSLRSFNEEVQVSCGNAFVLRADLLNEEEEQLLQTVARVVISCKEGSLAEQVTRIKHGLKKLVFESKYNSKSITGKAESLPLPDLEFFNGLGGFADDGCEYVTILGNLQYTPAPWINIVANEQIGFLVSESGSSYTWSQNSRENQITPWSNDPVVDPSGEVFYILDEDSHEFWTPTALPIRLENSTYIARHGQGYSSFELINHGIESKLTQFVSPDDPVKISTLSLKNHSNKIKKLSVTAYVEWVLGSSRTSSAPFVITELDEETKAILAYNPWNRDFSKRISFTDFSGKQRSWTADKTEFVGRNGSLRQPSGLVSNNPFSKNCGAGFDPCAAQSQTVEIAPGATVELVFFLGQTDDRDTARELIKRYRSLNMTDVLNDVKNKWNSILGKIQVKTPDRQSDFILNRWLVYQTFVCRYLARTAFYQAGGAYGFRDQLQDVMALTYIKPELTRKQIVNAAAHQFLAGDVQHWWHPPFDKGVRTRCSDDLLWLPYVTYHYIKTTGDFKILDEQISFLDGRELLPEEEGAYYEPVRLDVKTSLFDHCKRAIEKSFALGAHGLPLIGSCDWNDGMNMVGHKGQGESVWLAWFFYSTLQRFASLAQDYNETEFATKCLAHAEKLKKALEENAWDGAWYKRAFFDDGTPLGSSVNAECRIDSIAQSWSVISQAADKDRSIKAMESVDKYLVKHGDNIIMLFTPPFDKTPLDPGYIKGYLPGIRENGSQYTHAAVWNVIAFAMLGNGNKAYELFSMINPINHASTRAGVHRYKIEPYVIPADIYSEPPHVGRGGWSWYTGSAGWMYRAGIEWILGLTVEENILKINPCVPDEWKEFTISYQHGNSNYEVHVENLNPGNEIKAIEVDGKALAIINEGIKLVDDGKDHKVKLSI